MQTTNQICICLILHPPPPSDEHLSLEQFLESIESETGTDIKILVDGDDDEFFFSVSERSSKCKTFKCESHDCIIHVCGDHQCSSFKCDTYTDDDPSEETPPDPDPNP